MSAASADQKAEVARNKHESVKLADAMFKTIQNEEFLKLEPEDRHKLLIEKYPNFSRMYPVILRLMARDLKYDRKAFTMFLDYLEKNPGKGMEGFMNCQCMYPKFLYMVETKKRGAHINTKIANQIYNIEYENMNKVMKEIQKKEKEAKNEFKEETERNTEILRKELLQFALTNDNETDHKEDVDKWKELPTLPKEQWHGYEGPVEEKEKSLSELQEEYFNLMDRYYASIDKLSELNLKIEQVELRQLAIWKKSKENDLNDWLKGTAADKKHDRKQRKTTENNRKH